jgi:hypothetical protein
MWQVVSGTANLLSDGDVQAIVRTVAALQATHAPVQEGGTRVDAELILAALRVWAEATWAGVREAQAAHYGTRSYRWASQSHCAADAVFVPFTRHLTGSLLAALAICLASCGASAEDASPVTSAAPVTSSAPAPSAEATASETSDSGDSMTDVNALQAALEPLWPAFNKAADETGDFSTMTEGQRSVAFAWVLSGLVDNGGFPSWIESLGHRTPEAKTALAHLGATEYVPLLDEAMRLYPTYAAADPDERLSASDQWTEEDDARLEVLDQAFYDLSAKRELVMHYAAPYVAAHPDEFPA